MHSRYFALSLIFVLALFSNQHMARAQSPIGSGRPLKPILDHNKTELPSTLDPDEASPLTEGDIPDTREAPKTPVRIRMVVPQMKRSIVELKAYPYRTRPPRVFNENKELPVEEFAVKDMLLASGYQARLSLERPYPMGGWRWQYAYRNGLKASGMGVPHTIVEQYGWAKKLAPYVIPECRRINAIEEKRAARYKEAVALYEDNHREEELDANRLGNATTPIKLELANQNKEWAGKVDLSAGEWWITGTHKTPGLIYYWQEYLKIEPAPKGTQPAALLLKLDDSNALAITGGW